MKKIIILSIILLIGCLVGIPEIKGAQVVTLKLSPASGTYSIGENFSVDIFLDTGNDETSGVDVFLNYNSNLLEVQDANLTQTGIQIKPGLLYANTMTNKVDKTSGKIEFSQISGPGISYKGKGILATLTFKVLTSGTSSVTFDFTTGVTTDCNVAFEGQDVLSSVTQGKYILGAGGEQEEEEEEELAEKEQQERIVQLKTQIAEILAKIKQLQAQLREILAQGKEEEEIPPDFKFEKTLQYGDRGIEVRYLQLFLKNQGLEIYPEGLVTGFFGILTKKAVIRFQEKYAGDILRPWRLTYGTGTVGRTTRIKINEIFGY